MQLFLSFIAWGILYGGTAGFLFFRADNRWLEAIYVPANSGGAIGAFLLVSSLFGITQNRVQLFTCFIITIIISSVATVILLCLYLNTQNQSYRFGLKTIDILLGYKDALKMYYENRQKELDSMLDIERIREENKYIDERQKELDAKEEYLEQLKRDVEKNMNKTINMKLPLNHKVPVDRRLINILPCYVGVIISFANAINMLTKQYIEEYPKHLSDKSPYLASYFLALCQYTAKYLLDTNTRVHVRYLSDDGTYVKLVAVYGEKLLTDTLTSMPCDKGMIYQAGQAKQSLIKSLNPKFHIEGKNDHIWQDYITFVFDGIERGDLPLLSMGISVQNTDKYRSELCLLNYLKIEKIIGDNIKELQSVFDLQILKEVV